MITPPNTEYLTYPYVYLLSACFLLFFSKKYDIPIDKASPKSCIESERIATEFVNNPPKNSNIEKLKYFFLFS